MVITKTQLGDILHNMPDIDRWHPELVDELPKYQINTTERVAGFIAQCGHESSEFRRLEENLNYSAKSLMRVFGRHFKNRNPYNYARNPEKIANVVYANRIGNGGVRSGDGWRFRGRGIIQLTGRANYEDFGESVGLSAEEVIPYVQTIEGAIKAACWFWSTRGLNQEADERDIVGMTRRINGGTNGLKHRKVLWNRALRVLGDEGERKPADVVVRRLLAKGVNGEDVKVVQRLVGVTPDGSYGPKTKRAVRKWQIEKGLNPDGVVGAITRQAMGL